MIDKIILTDADGCLVDWNGAFSKFMTERGYPQLPDTDHHYSLALRHNISAQFAIELVKEFNEGRWISDLDAFADSVEYVKKLEDLGFRFIVVTSIGDTSAAKFHRTKNLFKLFGDVFKEINCIDTGASKAHILQNWCDSRYFWIEDHMRQAEAGHEVNLRPILISHPYNEHYSTELFPRVSNSSPWREIYDIVCADYQL